MKHISIIIICFGLNGCSFIVDLILFNNSLIKIEVCNLRIDHNNCDFVEVGSYKKFPLISTKPGDGWIYSINGNEYNFKFEAYPENASEIYCNGVLFKRCDIPVQLESNRLLYWAGKVSKFPVNSFPEQPPGFPVHPGA